MKKATISAALFVLGFIAAYLSLCYLIPGLRIKLAAPPAEYFLASIRHGALFKTLISAAVGCVFGGAALFLLGKRE